MEGESTSAAPAASSPAPSSSPSPDSSGASSAPGASSTPAAAQPVPGDGQPAATPATPAPAPRRYKTKVNGEELEIDEAHVHALAQAFGVPPEEILKLHGMAQSSYQRWKEAAKIRAEIEEREKASKARYEDPRIRDIKARDPSLSDEDAWAILKTQELYERSQQSPEQRALADERKKREDLERQFKEREEAQQKAELEAQTKAEATALDRSLTEAIMKHSLPKNPAWARLVLDHMAAAVRAGEVPDPEGSVLFVKNLVQQNDRARIQAMSDEQLEGWLGKEAIDRILKRSVERAKGAVPSPGAAPTPPPATEEQAPLSRFVTDVDAWRAKFR